MGLGTKIKEAMHGDKETTQQSPTTTSHKTAPGAFPADDVPRTAHNTTSVPSAGEPRTEPHGGKHSPDYALGGKERRHEGGLSQHGDVTNTPGMGNTTSSGVPHTGTTGTSHHNKLTKDAPYDEYGSGVGGTHGRSHNDGLASGHQGTHGTHGGLTGTGAHQEPYGTHGSAGMTGNHGNAAMAGAETGMTGTTHGTGMTGSHHGTGMAGANTGMTGANTGTTGSNLGAAGNTHNTPGMMTGATGSHVNYDDRINPGTPTTGNQSNVRTGTSTGGPGLSSANMTHRPADGGNNLTRDHKVDEYDAPTNSSGRGKQGLAGAAGGVAASELANRHHKDDMHAYDTPAAGADRSGMNTADRWHNSAPGHSGTNEPSLMGTTHMNPTGVNSGMTGGHPNSGVNEPMMGGNNATGPMGNTTGAHAGGVTGAHGHHNNSGSMLDPTGSSATHGTHGAGHTGSGGHTSMLDPHNTTSRTTYGHDTGHHSHHGHRENSDGMARGMAPHMAGGGMPENEYAAGAPESSMMPGAGGNHGMTGNHVGSGSEHGIGNNTTSHHNSGPMSGNPTTQHNTSGGAMGGIANKVPGMGDGHHGPGHSGAKVLHKCDHCGNDNDISRYFSKDAAYRMS
ncbi:hypothetical protein PG993_008707 [Apiospora rasikravindrae]|uniref:Cell surface protein n=1 Tax=Apiospora rasikravindrae TaxID=990691 RepID=A0ABR1SRF8_9PEZI